MSALKVEEEVLCIETGKPGGGETSRVGVPLRLGMVNFTVSVKVSASFITSEISTSDMTGALANNKTKYSTK